MARFSHTTHPRSGEPLLHVLSMERVYTLLGHRDSGLGFSELSRGYQTEELAASTLELIWCLDEPLTHQGDETTRLTALSFVSPSAGACSITARSLPWTSIRPPQTRLASPRSTLSPASSRACGLCPTTPSRLSTTRPAALALVHASPLVEMRLDPRPVVSIRRQSLLWMVCASALRWAISPRRMRKPPTRRRRSRRPATSSPHAVR